mmetsp:Transcript_14131/g.15632  ORF Transcript_14131/g.15632 Transcript_14131/m.15632 type:complete len:971 (-) Transcript_14131:88-3000(-)
MNLEQIKQGLLELLFLLQSLGNTQVVGLCQFVNPGASPELDVGSLHDLVQQSGAPQVEKLITEANQAQSQQYPEGGANSRQIEQFTTLWLLYQLQALLSGLSSVQLMKLFEVVPTTAAPEAQLNILQQLQQLFGDLQPAALQSLQEQIRSSPGMELKRLNEIMLLASQDFHLYQPLLGVLQLETHELLGLKEVLPTLEYIQLIQLLRLFAEGKNGSYSMMEYRSLLVKEDPLDNIQTVPAFVTPPSDSIVTDAQIAKVLDEASNAPPPTIAGEKLRLEIVEQPPDKCVYKRNVKPTPTVMIVGDNSNFDGNLYVVPTLLRCDTFEEEPELITGNKPAKVTTGRVLPFKRLKILCTSHQMKETLFSIRFELRKYKGAEYTVLGACTSNPIQVLSHSTQLKPAAHSKPVVQEVIPCSGPPSGFTRVAVLGNNFVDSPTTRVKFDKTEVMPIFHGPKTLICHTPRHGPGTVTVHVCNDAKRWSDTAGTFTYDDNIPEEDGKIATYIDNQFNLNIANSICEAAFEGGFETVRALQEQGADVNHQDVRGYAPIHYAAANGKADVAKALVDAGARLDVRDRFGNTALHYAVEQRWNDIASGLLSNGAMAMQNFQGNTPLHLAAINGDSQMAQCLIDYGAGLNQQQIEGFTCLHAAIQSGNADTVKRLIDHGAFTGSQDNEGETPLHWAVRQQSVMMVAYLLQKGVNANAQNADGETPLHLAAALAQPSLCTLLIAHGARVDARTADGSTPLHDAVYSANEAVVRSLLQPRVFQRQVQALDKQGITPIVLSQLLGKPANMYMHTAYKQFKAEGRFGQVTMQPSGSESATSCRNTTYATLQGKGLQAATASRGLNEDSAPGATACRAALRSTSLLEQIAGGKLESMRGTLRSQMLPSMPANGYVLASSSSVTPGTTTTLSRTTFAGKVQKLSGAAPKRPLSPTRLMPSSCGMERASSKAYTNELRRQFAALGIGRVTF